MENRGEASEDKVCRTCGHPGFVDSIATCSLCKVSCEHPYCMDLVRYEVPKDWRCEECLRSAEAVSNINLPVHQFSHKITSRKIGASKVKFITNKEVVTLTSGKRSHGKGNPRATGHRSDFAYVKPSPVSWKKVTPSRPKKGPDYAGVDISAPEHTMTSKPFNKKNGTETAVQVCKMKPVDGKASATAYNFSETSTKPKIYITDSMCADEGLMSMVDKHIENKTALKPQDDYSFIDEPPNASLAIKGERALHMEKDANVLPFNDSENKASLKRHDDYLFIDEQANASLSVKVERDVQPNNDSVAQHPLNIDGRHCCTFYPTFTQILSQKMVPPLKLVISSDEKHHHAVEACWRGAFEVLGFGTQFHGTVTAHLPCQVSPKVYDISKHLPGTLQFKMLARESVWPKIFKLDPPTKDDVALYFRCEVERHKEKYVHFIQHIDFHDYALQGCVSDVELLLLSSAQLQIDSQYLGGDIYLWGVFRHLKEKKASHEEEKAVSFSPSTPTAHITQGHSKVPLEVNSPEVAREVDKLRGSLDSKVDMEIDMIGGCSMGRIDVVSIKLEDAPPGFSKPIQRSPTSFGLKKCTDPLFLGAPPGFPFPAYRRSVPAALGKPTIASSSTTTNYGLADSTGK